MLSLKDILRGERPDVALDRHDDMDHRNYVPDGFYREPISPIDERDRVVSVSLDYEEERNDVRIVQN